MTPLTPMGMCICPSCRSDPPRGRRSHLGRLQLRVVAYPQLPFTEAFAYPASSILVMPRDTMHLLQHTTALLLLLQAVCQAQPLDFDSLASDSSDPAAYDVSEPPASASRSRSHSPRSRSYSPRTARAASPPSEPPSKPPSERSTGSPPSAPPPEATSAEPVGDGPPDAPAPEVTPAVLYGPPQPPASAPQGHCSTAQAPAARLG